jgi:hypothetical protein
LENPNRSRAVQDFTQATLFTGFANAVPTDNAYGAQNAAQFGFRLPDVISNIRVDQAWGFASASLAMHEVAGAYYGTGNNVTNGHPADRWGWAVSVGAVVNVPTTPGSQFGINFQWSEGASGYGAATGQTWSYLNLGTPASAGLGFVTDGIFGAAGTEIELTRVWNFIAFYQHIWNAKWRTSVYGGYVGVEFNQNAKNLMNPAAVCAGGLRGAQPSAAFVLTAGNSCDPDWSLYQIGTRTQWNPSPLLDIGLEVVYTRLNTMWKGAGTVTPGVPQNPFTGPTAIDDQSIWSAFFRWQRNFYP